MPTEDQSIDLTLDEHGRMSSATYKNPKFNLTEKYTISPNRMHSEKTSNRDLPSDPIPSNDASVAYNWVNSMASVEGRELKVNGKKVGREEFDRTLMSSRAIDGVKVDEIEHIKNAGGALAVEVAEMVKDGVNIDEFKRIKELNKSLQK